MNFKTELNIPDKIDLGDDLSNLEPSHIENQVNNSSFFLARDLLTQKQYPQLVSLFRSMILYFKKEGFNDFLPDFEYIDFFENCISVNDSYPLFILSIRLLGILFIEPHFIEYLFEFPAANDLMNHIATIFTTTQNDKIQILILQLFINLSGGNSNERDIALSHLHFSIVFDLLSIQFSEKIQYYSFRYIHNCCRFPIDIETGKQIMYRTSLILLSLSPASRIEFNYVLKYLSEHLLVDWYKSMEKLQLIEYIYNCFVVDNGHLAISAFHVVFRLMEYGRPLELHCDYFIQLISSGEVLNINTACWAIENLIKFDKNSPQLAKLFMDNNIIQLILGIFENLSFECRQSAVFALSAFAKCGLIEYLNLFIETDFIQEFLDFFSINADYSLKVEMLKALDVVFAKAVKIGKIEIAREKFFQNEGDVIFESLADDVDDEKGNLANRASRFLISYIYDN